MEYSGARGNLFHEKSLNSKISWQTPFNKNLLLITFVKRA